MSRKTNSDKIWWNGFKFVISHSLESVQSVAFACRGLIKLIENPQKNFFNNDIIMEIEGRIIMDLPLQSGTSKAGNPWKKKEWVLETFGTYPRKVKFHVFGDRVDNIRLETGRDYVLSFDLESREFNGRWYTDVNVYAARDYVGQNQAPVAPQGGYGQPQAAYQQPAPQFGAPAMGEAPSFTSAPANADEDLPF